MSRDGLYKSPRWLLSAELVQDRVSTSLKHCDACVRAYAFSTLDSGFSPMKEFPFAAGRQGLSGAYMD